MRAHSSSSILFCWASAERGSSLPGCSPVDGRRRRPAVGNQGLAPSTHGERDPSTLSSPRQLPGTRPFLSTFVKRSPCSNQVERDRGLYSGRVDILPSSLPALSCL